MRIYHKDKILTDARIHNDDFSCSYMLRF